MPIDPKKGQEPRPLVTLHAPNADIIDKMMQGKVRGVVRASGGACGTGSGGGDL